MSIITMNATVLDCPDPDRLARFYASMLDWKIENGADDDWVVVAGPDRLRLAFQKAPDHVPPQWPGDPEHGQQAHLDFDVPRDRMDEAEERALRLGAELVQGDEGVRNFRVYRDLAGHPFCLCAV